jgi:hypothetical protein
VELDFGREREREREREEEDGTAASTTGDLIEVKAD